MVAPPYRAAAAKATRATCGRRWQSPSASLQLPGIDADVVDLTVVDGERTLTVGGEVTTRPLPALDELAAEHESSRSHAERVDGDLFAVDVFPL